MSAPEEQLAEAWEHGQVVGTISVVQVDGVLMEVGLSRAWVAMRDAAAADGVTLRPTSGFRSMAEQQRLWAEHQAGTRTTPVARPGWSGHQCGRDLDIGVRASNTSPEFLWLEKNAERFGFRCTGASFSPPEWWHWELC